VIARRVDLSHRCIEIKLAVQANQHAARAS
jgi:hypothetical protein